MKKLFLLFLSFLFISIIFYPNKNITSRTNGSPGGYTNSVGDGGNSCTQCHSGTINTGIGLVSIYTNIPSSGYVPGQTYTVSATVSDLGKTKFGFETTAEDISGNKKGT